MNMFMGTAALSAVADLVIYGFGAFHLFIEVGRWWRRRRSWIPARGEGVGTVESRCFEDGYCSDVTHPRSVHASRAGRLCLVGVSVRGRSHAEEGRNGDDAFGWVVDGASDTALVVVADGVGSTHAAAEAASVTVRACLGVVRDQAQGEEFLRPTSESWAWGGIGHRLVTAAVEALEELRAVHPGVAPDSAAATTLAALLVIRVREGALRALVVRVGDSAVGVVTPAGRLRLLLPDRRAADVTAALPGEADQVEFTDTVVTGPHDLFVVSDGGLDALVRLYAGSASRPAMRSGYRRPSADELARLINDVAISPVDDCTVVLVGRQCEDAA